MHQFVTPGKTIISHLSFTHLREIMTLNDPLARYFYEQECIKCTWSVRELRRQISTNLYVRAGISANPDKLLSLPSVQGHDSAELQIRQPFTFEFLGLKAQDIVDEHDLEEALISHLQEFILELGKGFCFESRQKRIIIDDEYYYPDLVFYNRILHCGVIIELKNEEFSYENFGQLNAYVSRERDATRRQPSYRYPPLHTQGKENGGVCPCRYGQPTLRVYIYASAARQEDVGGVFIETVGEGALRGKVKFIPL